MNPLLGPVAKAIDALSSTGLPDPLPADPMPLARQWFDDAAASKAYADANAFTLATSTPDGRPSARIVLCKGIDLAPPAIIFLTNYDSRKGAEIRSNPHAAGVFHWPHAQRQFRFEGRVERLSEAESDAQFAARPALSQVGAWTSEQSRPLASRAELIRRVLDKASEFGVLDRLLSGGPGPVKRPPFWGGFRIVLERVELWGAGGGRLHDRAVWERTGSGWRVTRLAP